MLSINYVDPYQTDLGAILQVLLDFGIFFVPIPLRIEVVKL